MSLIRPPYTPPRIRAIAKALLPELAALFSQSGGSILQTINLVRSAYGLPSQRVAADIVQAGRDLASQLTTLQQETTFETIRPEDIPFNTNLPDPSGRGRRYRYDVIVTNSDNYATIRINSDDLLSDADIRRLGQSILNLRRSASPQYSLVAGGVDPADLDYIIRGIERRY